ncbi:hypothetical protein L873DRAFT_1802989 [Choiromyces venosus 120613-1]|uniref:Uncharacterized protein n=1 Tax=Choiromyces venosus 120613-1 TaxID=1336337 RepID=A0A3N4K017_9PEZI|nr:hypothetical protein L873DRAFT_1802989 [Choiromyces venosus 120613-1]
MKLTSLCLIASSTFLTTASASPHNRPRGVSEWGIGHYGGSVSEIPKNTTWSSAINNNSTSASGGDGSSSSGDNGGTGISNGSEAFNTTAAATPTESLALAALSTDVAAEPTATITSAVTVVVTEDQVTASITATPTPTPTPAGGVVKRGVHFLDRAHRGHKSARTEEEEVDVLVALLNHSFDYEHFRTGGECTPRQKGCAGNSVVECGSGGVWEVVADCDIPGLGLVLFVWRGEDFLAGYKLECCCCCFC